MRPCLARLSALAASLLLAGLAQAGTVTVVTSFPKELTQAYKAAFEKANPSIKIEVLNKNTVQGIAYGQVLGRRRGATTAPTRARTSEGRAKFECKVGQRLGRAGPF